MWSTLTHSLTIDAFSAWILNLTYNISSRLHVVDLRKWSLRCIFVYRILCADWLAKDPCRSRQHAYNQWRRTYYRESHFRSNRLTNWTVFSQWLSSANCFNANYSNCAFKCPFIIILVRTMIRVNDVVTLYQTNIHLNWSQNVSL